MSSCVTANNTVKRNGSIFVALSTPHIASLATLPCYSYPPKCPMCRALFVTDHFETQLDNKQLALVKVHQAAVALKPNEMLSCCKKCDYFAIEQKPGSVVWWCDGCGHGCCFVCHKDLPPSFGANHQIDAAKSQHELCKSLRFVKDKVEKAIELGSQMQCPGCGLSGRKDDACTHSKSSEQSRSYVPNLACRLTCFASFNCIITVTCTKCDTEWCYVCGLSVQDCDKAIPREGRPENDIYLHNRDWEINEKRCPMCLSQILQVDQNWLGEDLGVPYGRC